ncbi:MAG: aldehyde dehydrogenase [Blastococcus sp.]|jgi:acyl-CoA reductase-like NAD-dependent aldehyde dehydrogenase|nr:aldehyde dehydrogenase [Blastococcus sp.]
MSAPDVAVLRHLIGGEYVTGPTAVRCNPATSGTVVAEYPVGDASTVRAAVEAASTAFPQWRDTPAPQRGAVLMAAAELLAQRAETVATDLCREEGKTLAEARGEVHRAVAMLRYFGSEGWRIGGLQLPSADPGVHLYTVREPLGVVGLVTPWNFPIAIPTWKMAPALISGNTVVIKPAELTPVSVAHLVECLGEAGLPPGVVNVVYGRGREAGEAIVNDPDVAAVSFTGSVSVGRRINQVVAARMGRVQLELGGKNALVVGAGADLEEAATLAADSAFGLTGQACTATSRVIVVGPGHDQFVDLLARRARQYRAGDGAQAGVSMGPVVSDGQLATDLDYLAIAQREGAAVVAGGTHEGRMLDATVLADVRPDARIAREEVFGPLLAVLRADDLDEAIGLVNSTEFGLTAGLVTQDLTDAMTFSRRVEAGVIKINRKTTGTDLNAPFGGVKSSSNNLFREQGPSATDFYTQTKTVYLGV